MSRLKNISFFVILGFIIGLVLALKSIKLPINNLKNIFMFILFSYFNIYIHELGHVVMGLLVKFKIRMVKIGIGKELIRKKY